MYQGTYEKLEANASYLKRIHASGNVQNLELFDKPYKLALKILDHPVLSDKEVASLLGCNWQIVYQVRRALKI